MVWAQLSNGYVFMVRYLSIGKTLPYISFQVPSLSITGVAATSEIHVATILVLLMVRN